MTLEQRILMRLNAMRLRPVVEAKRIWVKQYLTHDNRVILKEMGFRFDANREAWYWKRQAPKPMHPANKRRAKKYQHELTDKSSK